MTENLPTLFDDSAAIVVLFILLQVCPPLPRPLPLLQRLFQSQETAGEDAADSVDATRPQRCLLLVRALRESIHV